MNESGESNDEPNQDGSIEHGAHEHVGQVEDIASRSLSSKRWKLVHTSFMPDSKHTNDNNTTETSAEHQQQQHQEQRPMVNDIQESNMIQHTTAEAENVKQTYTPPPPPDHQELINSSRVGGEYDSFASLSIASNTKHNRCKRFFVSLGYTLRKIFVPDLENMLRSTLNFLFRISLFWLYIIYIFTYFILVSVFVGLIVFASKVDPSCIRCGSMSFGDISMDGNTLYSCAFLLSWVTFSTVGYGNAWPATISDNAPQGRCYFINFVLFADAFSGIIFVGLCGAILYSRAQKIQSIASVLFSDIMVARFGSGLYGGGIDYEDDQPVAQSGGTPMESAPCPILEFRLVNTTGAVSGHEIIDAQIQCIAWTSSETPPLDSIRDIFNLDKKRPESMQFSTQRQKDSSCYISQGSVDLLNPTHPFFQHIWTAQHVLNESSPLITDSMKGLIQQNGGKWPKDYSNFYSIRQNLCFDEILVSMSGVYNLSGTKVYGGKTYKPRDLIVGYEFVHAITKGHHDNIVLETDLLHDVVRQRGDEGGEPLRCINMKGDEIIGDTLNM